MEDISGEEEKKMAGEPRENVTENLLIGHVQQKILIAKKIHPEDLNRNRKQLEHPVKTTGTKKERNFSGT